MWRCFRARSRCMPDHSSRSGTARIRPSGATSVRAHALEAGAFVLSACGQIEEADISDDLPYKGRMNIGYAKGGSSIIAPLGVPIAGPIEGPAIVRAELQAWMIKAWKAIIDTNGDYARPDLVRLSVNEPRALTAAGAASHPAQAGLAGRGGRAKRRRAGAGRSADA